MPTGIRHVPLRPGSSPDHCLLTEPVTRQRVGTVLRREVSHCPSCSAATRPRGKVRSKVRVLAPNNSMEPPPLRSGDLRPIPASWVFGFGAILALAGQAAHLEAVRRQGLHSQEVLVSSPAEHDALSQGSLLASLQLKRFPRALQPQ